MIQKKFYWEEFQQEQTFVTHEFCGNCMFITVGIWQGQRVALKRGRHLEKEIEIMKEIGDHPNIIKFLGEIDGDILMEGVKDGLTIEKYCEWRPNQTALSLKLCISLMKQLASALKYLHNKGIIHHDLKTENVLIDLSRSIEEPIIKLCDFGISEKVDENGHGKEQNREYGTYHSIAPEQKKESTEPITFKIDVYAFGGICNAILLKGRSLDQVLYCCPIKLCNISKECLNENPKDRPTMDKIIEMLDDPNILDSPTYKTIIVQIYEEYKKNKIPLDNIQKLYEKVLAC